MKKLLCLLTVACTLAATSCKKTTTTPTTTTPTTTTPTIPTDGWKLGSTSYKQAFGYRSGSSTLSAADAIPSGSNPQVNSFNAFFKTLPSASGTYKVVMYAGGVNLAADEVGFSAGLYNPGKTYVSAGNDNVKATVTVAGGKIKIELPELKTYNTAITTDTLILTGTIIEN